MGLKPGALGTLVVLFSPFSQALQCQQSHPMCNCDNNAFKPGVRAPSSRHSARSGLVALRAFHRGRSAAALTHAGQLTVCRGILGLLGTLGTHTGAETRV